MMEKKARRRIYTPEAVATIRKMAGAGKSADEIAKKIGTSKLSLTTRCYRLCIALPRDPTSRKGNGAQWADRNHWWPDDVVQMCVRLSGKLRQTLKDEAWKQRRSLNMEVVRRLERSFQDERSDSRMQLAVKQGVEVAIERLAIDEKISTASNGSGNFLKSG